MEKNEEENDKIEQNNDDKEKNKDDPYISRKKLIYVCFAFIGLVNNLGYVLIITSAQQFASKLNNDTLIAFYPLALIVFNSSARVINSKSCITISYFKRILFLSIYFCIGYLFLFAILLIIDNSDDFDEDLAFFLTLIPAVIMGTGQSFGEATFLGYIRTFPEDYVSGWSSGTGLAGVFGASLSLIFKLIQESFDLKNLYLIISPVTVLFFLAFYITYRIKNRIDNELIKSTWEESEDKKKENDEVYEGEERDSKNESLEIKGRLSQCSELLNGNQSRASDVSLNKNLSCGNFTIAFKYGKRYILNMFIVYFLEYSVCTGFSERANFFKYVDSSGAFYEKAQYETFLLFYQLGVVLSRSSLLIYKYLKFVELLNIIQFCNFVFWFLEALLGITSNQYVCFVTLILLGLCGGGVYVGCFYFILNDINIPPHFKELVLNISTLFNDFGVLLSSVLCVIFDNTFMKTPLK